MLERMSRTTPYVVVHTAVGPMLQLYPYLVRHGPAQVPESDRSPSSPECMCKCRGWFGCESE